jgi:hypothetical protein
MNSRKDRETLDDIFRLGLAPYREASPPKRVETALLRSAQQQASGQSQAHEVLFKRLGERPLLRQLSNAFQENPAAISNEMYLLPTLTLLNRHVIAVRLF